MQRTVKNEQKQQKFTETNNLSTPTPLRIMMQMGSDSDEITTSNKVDMQRPKRKWYSIAYIWLFQIVLFRVTGKIATVEFLTF